MKTGFTSRSRIGACAAIGTALAGGALVGSAAAQEVLPVPPAPFKGQIGLSVKDSKSDFPQPVKAPKGAPNRFSGTIKKIVIDSQPAKLSTADQQKLQDMERTARLKVE
jgi:hypothetical protein